MRTIERSSTFKRDYKREAKGQYRNTLDDSLSPVLQALASNQQLEPRYRDHDLIGDWGRLSRMPPDLLLIYRKSADDLLRLARLGSHSELFG
jgi:mRNA interferase YafQ